MAHPDGELATARANARRKVWTMAVSSFATYPVKEIREAGLSVGPIKHAMQMYTLKDRDLELGIDSRGGEARLYGHFLDG